MKLRISPPVWALFLLVCTAAVFWPGLNGGFIFDDIASIVDNQRVHAEQIDAQTLSRAARSFVIGDSLF